MSTHDLLRFIYGESQVDADAEETLREAQSAERLEARKTPLLKALRALDIPTEQVTVDEEGGRLTLPDAVAWSDALKKLGTVEAMNSLADEGWVPEFVGEVVTSPDEPGPYILNFLCLHVTEPSELNKAVGVDALNKEVESGSDAIIPKEQAARDKERHKSIKESADHLLESPDEVPAHLASPDQPPTCPKCGVRVPVEYPTPESATQPQDVKCPGCGYAFTLENDEDDDYENPLDNSGNPIVVAFDGDGKGQLRWDEFVEANADGMDWTELAEIRRTILQGKTYEGGGGAAGVFKVWRVRPVDLDVQAGLRASGMDMGESAKQVVEHAITNNGVTENLTTFKNERVIFALPNGETLVEVDRAAGEGGRMLVAVTADGFNTDYPIRYDGGKIGWDNPEWFSEEFLAKARDAINANQP